jgi:hypothetical protein
LGSLEITEFEDREREPYQFFTDWNHEPISDLFESVLPLHPFAFFPMK